MNADHVPPARRGRYQRKGWVASTIRDILYNRAYVGEWKFKKRQWQKVPGTNTRRYRDRPANEVIQRTYPERRIIDDETWTAVQARLADVRVCYAGRHDQPKGRATGRQNNYILSGLLYCGACQAPMTIHAGTSARYYRCSDQKKRGTCANRLALREDVARRRILGAVRERYSSPAS
ncbi:MAG TPA: recombinase zinc beta ribbon domain-containing protein, partial [Polyangiaceae bacterium]|nr:recombinase zinc beta ribbon domain-containing protein [Polyangiaceae bacterium]